MVKVKATARADVAAALRRARASRRVSQGDLAEMIGVSQPVLSRLESGTENITVDSIVKYAEALGLVAYVTLSEANLNE